MATLLQKYSQLMEMMEKQAAESAFPLQSLLEAQEIQYRIMVLKSCQFFCKTAPVTAKVDMLSYHYQVVDAFLRTMLTDHKFGVPSSPELKQKRQTAMESLQQVLQNGQKKFSSFRPATPELYKKNVSDLINTVLPAWIQYRDAYIDIKKLLSGGNEK